MMNVRSLVFCVALVGAVLGSARSASATELDFTASQLYARNDTVKVVVRATGSVLITSEFDNSSTVVDVMGSKTLDVGKVTGPGTFRIAASDDKDEAFLEVLVIPEEAKLRFITSRGKAQRKRTSAVAAADKALLKKFLDHVDRSKVQSALNKAAKDWAASNATSIGSTAIVCLLTLAEPVAAKFCKDGAADAFGDLGIELLEKLVDEVQDHGLSKQEAAQLRLWIKLGKTLKLVKLDKKALDELHELLGSLSSVIDNMEFKNDKVKIVLKTGVDLAHKYLLVVEIAKPTH